MVDDKADFRAAKVREAGVKALLSALSRAIVASVRAAFRKSTMFASTLLPSKKMKRLVIEMRYGIQLEAGK